MENLALDNIFIPSKLQSKKLMIILHGRGDSLEGFVVFPPFLDLDDMNYILFDGPVRNQLLPFTYTRPVADIRVGILTIREKWEHYLQTTTTTVTEDYLSDKFPMVEMEEKMHFTTASTHPENMRSQHLLHQLGFEKRGPYFIDKSTPVQTLFWRNSDYASC